MAENYFGINMNITKEDINRIASIAAEDIQTQYPDVDYILVTVKDAVVDAIYAVIKE